MSLKILVLKNENIDLSIGEAVLLLNGKKIEKFDNKLIIQSSKSLEKRLALTNRVYEFLFSCNKRKILEEFHNFDWNREIKGSFCVRVPGKSNLEKTLASFVWKKIKNPKVRLKNAQNEITIFFSKEKAFVGILESVLDHEFINRAPHKRPFHLPISLHPKLARAMVNMTGITKGRIFDPFCGTGGILIEAGLMGLKTEGYDIDLDTVIGCRKNLEHYGIKGFKIEKKDALKIDFDLDYICTDLPYMKNTKNVCDPRILYKEFFKKLEKHLKKRAIVGFEDHIRIRLPKGLKKVNQFIIPVHRSMSKKIIVLEKQK